jgi:iron complex transport system substrate-binding protein
VSRPIRICSLLPAATEIAFALGLGDALVGVTRECDFPPEARQKPVVVECEFDAASLPSGEIDRAVRLRAALGRSPYRIDLERLRSLDPTLIVTQELCGVCALDAGEAKRLADSLPHPVEIVYLTGESLAGVLADIRRFGAAAGAAAEAEALVARRERRIERVETSVAAARRPRVACLEWLDPLYIAGHWVPEMAMLAGGAHELRSPARPSAEIEWGKVREYDPEVLVLMPCGFSVARAVGELHLLSRLPGWNDISAVAARRVYAVDAGAFFSRPGPRLVDGLEILAQILHPEIFPWRAPPEAAVRL